MGAIWIALGGLCLILVSADAVEAVLFPRSVNRSYRLSGLYFRSSWSLVRWLAQRVPKGPLRQTILVAYAPLSLVILFAVWASLFILGFGLIHYGHGTAWNMDGATHNLPSNLYVSGVNFFTLGLGDVTTKDGFGRWLNVTEAGVGFGFLALVIGYLPVIYTSFSRREWAMVLLDSKAGSESSATELLRRFAEAGVMEELSPLLKSYEEWSASLLEGYLSFPVLAFYRSQHETQSWLKTMTTILDTCTLVEVGIGPEQPWSRSLKFQARATFAMARHVIVDLAYVLNIAPDRDGPERLPDQMRDQIRSDLAEFGIKMAHDPESDLRLVEIRATYEPYVRAMATGLYVELPEWRYDSRQVDNWQTSAWDGMRHF